jgi:uncharacterized protein
LEFERHDAKAAANLQAHGVGFETAKTVFRDPFAIEFLDDRQDYGGSVLRLSAWRRIGFSCS